MRPRARGWGPSGTRRKPPEGFEQRSQDQICVFKGSLQLHSRHWTGSLAKWHKISSHPTCRLPAEVEPR